jgi:2-dehydro-3-deoxygalactonokinase
VGPAALIAIDWGTTSARAYRLNAGGHVVGEHSAHLGIAQVADGAFDRALSALIGDWADEPAPRIACGMIGSRQGWVEAPYRACPVALETLAAGVVTVPGGRLGIVPGVTCTHASGVPDVMRGEETQILGAVGDETPAGRAPDVLVLPGTHSKWARVAGGTIEGFTTFLTGECYAVLKDHSILGRLMAAGPASPGAAAEAFARGVRAGLSAEASLLHDLFGARTLPLFDRLAPAVTADYLSGLLIGHEIRDGRAWLAAAGVACAQAMLIGAPLLVERYAEALRLAGIAAVAGPADAAARGLWRVAQSAGLLGGDVLAAAAR